MTSLHCSEETEIKTSLTDSVTRSPIELKKVINISHFEALFENWQLLHMNPIGIRMRAKNQSEPIVQHTSRLSAQLSFIALVVPSLAGCHHHCQLLLPAGQWSGAVTLQRWHPPRVGKSSLGEREKKRLNLVPLILKPTISLILNGFS